MIAVVLFAMAGLMAKIAEADEEGVMLNDILEPDLLPGNILLDHVIIDGNFSQLTTPGTNASAGDFGGALETMEFHRRMMNEYLCRGYLAGQILGDVAVSSSAAPRAEKRLGSPPPAAPPPSQSVPAKPPRKYRRKSEDVGALPDNLLADPGSAKYKKWLARTTTLEDIYRHYDADGGGGGAVSRRGPDGEDFRSALRRPFPPHNVAIGKTGYSSSGSGGGYSSYGGGGGGKAMKADKGSTKDTMDIALTAMAFLSFALFKVNVIACLLKRMMSSGPTPAPAPAPAPAPTIMMLPSVNVPGGGGGGGGGMVMLPALPGGMMMGGGGGGMGGGGPGGGGFDVNLGGNGNGGLNIGADGRPIDVNLGGMMMGRRRRRREAGSDVARADEVARRALETLEALHVLDKDGGQCLRLWLCENNRFSRQLGGEFTIWLPLWSFGMSWIGGKMARSQSTASAMLENLRASVLGMGDSECDVVYPDCSERILAAERQHRQRRRRRSRRGDAGNPRNA